MQRLQKLVADKIRQDPDVTGVVSVVGVSPLNATPNAGRLTITLIPRGERKATVSEIIERLQHAIADIAGMTVFFQPVQDIQISTRASRAQYQYTLVAHRRRRSGAVVRPAGRCAARQRDPARRLVGSAGGRPARDDQCRPREGRAARHLDAGGQRHAQRRVRPAADFHHLRAGEPVPRDPRSRAAVPARSVGAVQDLHPGEHSEPAAAVLERAEHPAAVELHARRQQHAGAALGLRRDDPHHGAARDRASGAVPLGDLELQPRAWRGARRRGRDHLVGRARDRDAGLGDRQLFGRHRGVRQVAAERAVADPRGRGDDLHRARRAVRKLHPSAHDPLDACRRPASARCSR